MAALDWNQWPLCVGMRIYLPFCMMFVSSDKLHRRSASLFLRSNQQFVWGHDLKDDLNRLNTHYLALPEVERDLGVMRIARHPPIKGEYLTTALWRKWMSDAALSEPDYAGELDSRHRAISRSFRTDRSCTFGIGTMNRRRAVFTRASTLPLSLPLPGRPKRLRNR